MTMGNATRSWALAVLAAVGPGCAGQIPVGDETDESAVSNPVTWASVRDQRQQAIDAYLAANRDDFQSFKNAPLGDAGIPMIMFRLFPVIFPDLWGAESDHFASVGFAKDDFEPGRVLPLGMGQIGSTPAIPVPTPNGVINLNVRVAAMTCAGCHSGRVIGPDGGIKHLIGAPSTTFNQLRLMVSRTVNDPRYTADNFRNALNARPLGWVYQDPALGTQEYLERAVFNAPATDTSPSGADKFLGGLKARVNAGAQRFAQTLGAYTYQVPNAPDLFASKPGYLDAIGAGITIIADPTKMTADQLRAGLPPAPAEIDIMSTWNQAKRPAAQWDGSITSQTHRNLAAEFGVIGDPTHLNMDNVNRTTRLTQALPPSPYPFDVDMKAAERGKRTYDKSCAGCHAPGKTTIFPSAQVGTDPNRANIWTAFSIGGLVNVLRFACTDPVTCNAPDGSPLPSDQIVKNTGGYMAVSLEGIWARAPYLHNGSVPNLYALITGERPAQFYRGNVAYDQQKVGFVSDQPGARGAIYDTTRSGNSNTGHTGPQFLGNTDWKGEPETVRDVLEYLKTL
jgi:hypothetical protein